MKNRRRARVHEKGLLGLDLASATSLALAVFDLDFSYAMYSREHLRSSSWTCAPPNNSP